MIDFSVIGYVSIICKGFLEHTACLFYNKNTTSTSLICAGNVSLYITSIWLSFLHIFLYISLLWINGKGSILERVAEFLYQSWPRIVKYSYRNKMASNSGRF